MPFPFGFRRKKLKKHQGLQPAAVLNSGDQHRQEREQFKAVLESFGATRIRERLLILDIFLSTEKHLSLRELEELVKKRTSAGVDLVFLEETMKMFCQFGFAQERLFDTSETLYEHQHLGTHHDHFICTWCGKIEEFVNPELERLQMIIARESNFHPLQHKMEIYGLCASCMAGRETKLPLLLAANGERVRIVAFEGSREEQMRFADLGLRIGSCLEVINNQSTGPFIIALKETRLAINADIARKIMVRHSCRHEEV